jgi:hypothetical protein
MTRPTTGAMSAMTAATAVPVDARTATAGAGRDFIWGATAAMLRNLYRFLSA